SETEQTLRAQAFAEAGLLTIVGEAGLSPHSLATGINQALSHTPPADGRGLTGIRLRGAEETAEIVCGLAAIVPS
ncbi:MAG: glycosyltransferase, partial [Alphaproteobacteria bacterium]